MLRLDLCLLQLLFFFQNLNKHLKNRLLSFERNPVGKNGLKIDILKEQNWKKKKYSLKERICKAEHVPGALFIKLFTTVIYSIL
jgi:hypothetical protein